MNKRKPDRLCRLAFGDGRRHSSGSEVYAVTGFHFSPGLGSEGLALAEFSLLELKSAHLGQGSFSRCKTSRACVDTRKRKA